MKKLLTILAVATISMTSFFANSTQIQLKTNVPEVIASFVLQYNGNTITGENNEIATNQLLSTAGQTKDFTINSSSNYNIEKIVVVSITPDAFILQRNNKSSEITPEVNWIHNTVTRIPAGVQNNFLISKFNLKWDGSSKATSLDAGTYVSNVKIEYTTT